MRRTRTRRAGVAGLAAVVTGAGSLVGLLATPAGAAPAAAPPAAVYNTDPAAGAVNATPCSSSCELHAVAGSFTVHAPAVTSTGKAATTTTLSTWRFATSDLSGTDLTRTAMPVLLVDQGSTFTVTLDNNLPVAAPISLTIPGMRATAGANDSVGVAPGSAKAYTFVADRPGTYLYEAGHTVNGPRAVAMGLVGAVVVRPSDFGAGAAQTDLGAASGTTFDDEQVMVLTDVDPGLANDPLGFDLRNLHATYRLVNGAAYPNVPVLASQQDHRVLLRYVNGGVQSHAMGPVGLRQQVVGIDGEPAATGALVADSLPAGQTEDAILTVPAGRTVVADQSGDLDNSGAVVPGESTGTNRRVDFGGMIQVIDALAVQATADTTPPAVTLGAVGGSGTFTVPVTVADRATSGCATAGACGPSDLQSVVFSVDGKPESPVPGFAATAGVTTFTGTVTVGGLGDGTHTVAVRAQDAAGNWSVPAVTQIVVSTAGPATTGLKVAPTTVSTATGAATVALSATGDASADGGGSVTAMQYAVAAGTGAAPPSTAVPATMTVTPGQVVAGTATVSVPVGSTEGTWTAWVQSKGANGVWGSWAGTTFTVDNTAPTAAGVTLTSVDPKATDGVGGSAIDPASLAVQATFADTPKAAGTVTTPIVAAEGFLGTSSAGAAPSVASYGRGFVFVANDGTFDGSSSGSVGERAYGLVPLSQLTQFTADGTYDVWVHGRDAAGNWGVPVAVPFVIDRTPHVTGLAVTQNALTSYTLTVTGTSAAAVTSLQYGVGPAAPASGTACTATGTKGPGAVSLSCTVTVTSAQLTAAGTAGRLTFWARMVSTKGTGAWTSGSLANLLASNAGPLAVGSGTATTVALPTAPPVTGYLDGMTFDPGTLVTGTSTTGYVTVENLVNGRANVVAVQYRRASATTRSASFRLLLNGAAVGNPYTVSWTSAAPPTYKLGVTYAGGSRLTLSVAGTVRVTGATVAAGSTLTASSLAGRATSGTVSLAGAATITGWTANRFTTP